MVTYPLSENVPMLSRELDDNAGRMWVWCAGVCNCIIGSSAMADVLASCPKATVTVLLDGPVIGRPSLGLLK